MLPRDGETPDVSLVDVIMAEIRREVRVDDEAAARLRTLISNAVEERIQGFTEWATSRILEGTHAHLEGTLAHL